MNIMEKKLNSLFDYQRFAGNDRLSAMIKAAESGSGGRELSEDDLAFVNAAGEFEVKPNALEALRQKP